MSSHMNLVMEIQALALHMVESGGKLTEAQSKKRARLLLELELSIDANARITDRFKQEFKYWNLKTEQLCSLRDLLKGERKIDDASVQASDTQKNSD